MSSLNTDNKKIKKQIEKFQKSGNIQQAIETCKNAISCCENDAELHIKLGDLYMEKHLDIRQIKQYVDDAVTEYQRALESCMTSPELYCRLGRAFYYKRELDKALNYFRLALEYDEKSAEAHYMTALIYMKKGEFTDACEEARKAVSAAPFSSSRAYMLLFNASAFLPPVKRRGRFLNLAAAVLTLPFDKDALKECSMQLSYLQFAPVLIKASLIIFFKGFNQEVLEIYRETIDKAPGFVDLYINLGRIYCELKRYEDAVCEYKMAVWLDSLNVRALYYLCRLYEELKDYENAADICRKLIKIQPNSADFHCKLAQYLYLMGSIEEAAEHYQTAVTLNPNPQWTSVAAQTLGFIFQENIKNLDAAISSYQTACCLNPEDIDIYLNLGNVFFEKEAFDNALTVYKKALEIYPENARLHCNLGYLYWGKGNIDEAVKEYEKAILYDSAYDIAYNNLGVIYLDDLGKVKKAIELFEAAKKCNPNYALAHYNLARSIAVTGDKIGAAKLYQAALDINMYTKELDPSEIEEKIQELFT